MPKTFDKSPGGVGLEIWGPRLPSGWVYPASRRQLRDIFADLDGVGIRMDRQSPVFSRAHDADHLPVVAEAHMYHSVRGWPFEPRVTVYGWRTDAYPDEARSEFMGHVLGEMHAFLVEQVSLESTVAAGSDRRNVLRVLWHDGSHEFVTTSEASI